MRILVTGFNGFVGKALTSVLLCRGYTVRGAGRTSSQSAGMDTVAIETIGPGTQWTPAVNGIYTVIHLAARTHVLREQNGDALAEYRLTNVMGTERLAREAAAAGVKRFIYLSTVKVNGEMSREPYRETDTPAPQDPYGISKWEAEQALHRIAAETTMEVVILRPPLVYGPGVKANFLNLMRIIDTRIPLPLAGIRNLRSLIFVDNLVDAIVTCISHRNAAGQTYLVSDGEDISTTDLVRKIAHALGRTSLLFPLPVAVLRAAGSFTGRSAAIERLTGSLRVSTDKIRRELGWTPPHTLNEGLTRTAEWFRNIPIDRPGQIAIP